MKTIVYLTINTVNHKIYVGVHTTENPDVFDGYLGCGCNRNAPSSYKRSRTPFQYAINKYGVDAFRRYTLAIFDNEEDAFELESKIVTEEFIRLPYVYNTTTEDQHTLTGEFINKPIYLYNLDGTFFKEYSSPIECAKSFGLKNSSSISSAIRLGRAFKGYQVYLEKVESAKKLQLNNQKKLVDQYDMQGNYIKTWDSITAAVKEYGQSVCRCIKGQSKHCKNFIFKLRS